MKSEFRRVFEGKRWSLVHGDFSGVEKTAVVDLQKLLQYYAPYVVEIGVDRPGHVALVGTEQSNPRIAELIRTGFLAAPCGPESYSLALAGSPGDPESRLLVVAGTDPRGVLYGVQEMSARVFQGGTLLDGFAGPDRLAHLEKLPEFRVTEGPAIADRGIWTWGYPIARLEPFLDSMVRLRLNLLTLWNDELPLNIEEVIEAAHGRGIRVVLGFHWGWGHTGSINLANASDRAAIRDTVLENYRRNYAHLRHDGIYFQTLTEHKVMENAGRSTAWWARELVNDTASALLGEFPGLGIQFGLHATSIGENYRDLESLDPRVTIVWEDCFGQIPYTYCPAQEVEVTASYDHMLDFSRRIATFRPGAPFALVPKGWTCIRWQRDFENHGPFLLGRRSALESRERLAMRQNEWDRINAHWFENYPAATRFYRELLAVNPAMVVTALVEDGLLEERIAPSVALYAETVWNPARPDAEILARAMRPSYLRWS